MDLFFNNLVYNIAKGKYAIQFNVTGHKYLMWDQW